MIDGQRYAIGRWAGVWGELWSIADLPGVIADINDRLARGEMPQAC